MSHHYYLPPAADEAVRSWIRRHKRSLRSAIVVGLLLVFVLVGVAAWAFFRGALRITDWLAQSGSLRIPLQWEQPLGEAALLQMRIQFRFLDQPAILEPFRSLAAPLLAGLANPTDRFTFLVTDSKEINALALHGGYVVFHRGLLERARSAEEVQGVLAHEMAHILKRHGVLQLAQNIGLDLIVRQILGNENQLLDSLIKDSGQLLGLKFSRDHERAADDLGWELLEKSQVNPLGMVDFFSSLKAESEAKGTTGFALEAILLSTHPTPQERIDRLTQKAAAMGRRSFKSFATEFRALQEGLRPIAERP